MITTEKKKSPSVFDKGKGTRKTQREKNRKGVPPEASRKHCEEFVKEKKRLVVFP